MTRALEGLVRDLRFAIRALRKERGYTAVVVATLTVGIGANAALFGVVNAALLRPPPVEEPDRLVALFNVRPSPDGMSYERFSYPELRDLRSGTRSFQAIAGRGFGQWMWLDLDGFQRQVDVAFVTSNYFPTLGIEVARGSGFRPEEEQEAAPTAVISNALWRQAGFDPAILGKSVRIDGQSFAVVGVAPEGFSGIWTGFTVDVWLPISAIESVLPDTAINEGVLQRRSARWLTLLGRLVPAVDLRKAQTEADTMTQRLAETYPASREDWKIMVTPHIQGYPTSIDRSRRAAVFLLPIAGLLLLAACANVANIQLARSVRQRREIAMRLALGGSAARIFRQLLTESLVLSLLSGSLAVLAAHWVSNALLAWVPYTLLVPGEAGVDGRVLGFGLVVSLATALIFGLGPALQSSRPDLVSALKESPRANAGRRWRLGDMLVVSQIAISTILLVGAGLFLRSLWHLGAVDPGFEADRLLVASVDLPARGLGDVAMQTLLGDLQEELKRLPGVEAVSVSMQHPAFGGFAMAASPGDAAVNESAALRIVANLIGPGTLSTAGIPMVMGREFEARDEAIGAALAIVDRTLAQRLWPNENPLGKTLRIEPPGFLDRARAPLNLEVIGVAEDTLTMGLWETMEPSVYLPIHWYPEALRQWGASLSIRSAEPEALVADVRRLIQEVGGGVRALDVRPLSDVIDEAMGSVRSPARLTGLLAGLAAVLAATGVYGLMAHRVSRSTREIGIRIALGARFGDVVGTVLARAGILVLAGLGVGLSSSLAFARIIESQLHGVGSWDPITYATASLAFVVIALAASLLPAVRATRVDPADALRST